MLVSNATGDRQVDELAIDAFHALHDMMLYVLKVSKSQDVKEVAAVALNISRYWMDVSSDRLKAKIRTKLSA
jgi:hypothetical protein